MAETIRLSDASARITAALAALDNEALQELTAQLKQVTRGQLEIIPEPATAVRRELRILEDVLTASGRNIEMLQRLRERKARNEWGL